MLNLSISAPGTSETSPSELAAVAVDSPLKEAATSPGSGGAETSGTGAFSAFLARAMSTPEVRALASADGKSLPVSDLQTQLLGKETRLVMSAGSELPGEESLYAFAIQQGMDPATVAAVLWPGMPVPPGVTGAAGMATGADGKGQNPMLTTAADTAGLPLEASVAVAGVSNATPGITSVPIGAGDFLGPSANASVSRLEQLLGSMGPPSAVAGTAERFAVQGRDGVLSAAAGLTSALDARPVPGLDPRAVPGLDRVGVSASSLPGPTSAAGTAGIIGAAGSGKAIADLTASPMPGVAIPFGTGNPGSAGGPASRVDIAVTQAAASISTLPATVPMPSASQVLSLSGRSRSISAEAGATWATAANGGLPLIAASAGAPIIGAIAGHSSPISGAVVAAGAMTVNGISTLQAGGQLNQALVSQALMGLSSESAASVDALEPSSEPASCEGILSDSLALAASDGAESSGPGHHPGGNRAPATAGEPLSLRADELGQGASGDADAEERQAMTQRLAEGLAQRISAQIAQNNWKLQVELRPAHLGQVNIELAMTGGQLEARFDATQAASRAMIQEGLDRLRQDLEKSGMNVAYLGMQAGGGSSGGGKPTLRPRSGEPAQVGEVDAVREPVPNERSSRVGRDGLDVMV